MSAEIVPFELIELLGEMGVGLGRRRGEDSRDELCCGIGGSESSWSGGLGSPRTTYFRFVCEVWTVAMSAVWLSSAAWADTSGVVSGLTRDRRVAEVAQRLQ